MLIEFLIAFAVLSLAVIGCGYAFSTTVREYAGANERLKALTIVQNSLERQWAGQKKPILNFSEEKFKTKQRVIASGIVLPIMPILMQEWLEVEVSAKISGRKIRVRGWIKGP